MRRPGALVRFLRVAIPFAISAALLGYLFSRIDVRAVGDSITPAVALRWLLPLLIFNLVSLAIEARCLHRVVAATGAHLDYGTAARIKAACYLLSILNYLIGAAGLSILLRRRARLGLADAASVVFLISLFDIGAVLCLAAVAASFLQTETLGVRIGLLGALLAAILLGFVFLRVPTRLGPLERLRRLDLFRSPRTAPASLLVELGALRALFVLCYVALMSSLFWAFQIEVDPIHLGLNVALLLVVSALPIAAGGLGTGQIAFVALFSGFAPDAELLAASILFTVGLISSRALLGWAFAMEFTREALVAARREARI
jgi:uncharacterized membrane protein YbhN (UPF0104 family)